MKVCTKCQELKNEKEFFVKDKESGKLHTQCKECYKEHRKSYYVEHYERYHESYLLRAKKRREALRNEFRINMLEYLRDKFCVVCGESDVRALEFDHIDPACKSFNISQSVKLGHRWERVVEEIKKCRILCANCYKKHTSSQYGWYKAFQE